MSELAPAARYPEGREDMPDAETVAGLSGVEFMRGVRDGRLPAAPMARALNFGVEEVEEGRVTFLGRPLFDHFNPIGSVHGGWYGALLDSVMGCAVHSVQPAGRGYTTLEYKVSLLRGIPLEAGPVRAIGEVLHAGRRTATAEGRIVGVEDGRLYATGTTTCLVFDLG